MGSRSPPVPGASWPHRGSACGVASPAYAGRAVPMREVPSRNPTPAPIRTALPARTGRALALRPGFLRVPCNPRPCGKCPADGGRRERRHQEAEGGLRCSFRNPAAQPEMALTACIFLESLPHTLRCGPLFLGCAHSRLRTGHRLPPSWDRGPDGGERGGASHGGTVDSSRALVDAAEIYHIIIFIMLILCRFIP